MKIIFIELRYSKGDKSFQLLPKQLKYDKIYIISQQQSSDSQDTAVFGANWMAMADESWDDSQKQWKHESLSTKKWL